MDLCRHRHLRHRNVVLPDHDARNTLPQTLGTKTYHQDLVNGSHLRRSQLSQLLFLSTHRLLRGNPGLLRGFCDRKLLRTAVSLPRTEPARTEGLFPSC
jgi:hypothetical protein